MTSKALKLMTVLAVAALVPGIAASAQSTKAATCNRSAAIQVLGSGGPMHGGGRGSSAYLLWLDGLPAAVIDMGGDTPTALARAGVEAGQLPALLLTHLHPDHVSGIPDFLWGEMTAQRKTQLLVVGPPAAGKFHNVRNLFDRLFGSSGAFPDMQSLLAGQEFPLSLADAKGDGSTVLESSGLAVRALKVPHGRAPSLAYRIEATGSVAVVAADQTLRDPAFVQFAAGADILIVHAMLNRKAAKEPIATVVPLPSDIVRVANATGAKRILFSHLMGAPATAPDAHQWSLADLAGSVADVQHEYDGQLAIAEDLGCYEMSSNRSAAR